MANGSGSAVVREWATFEDPREPARRWRLDLTFLASSWQCIYGQGCQGVLTEPAPELEQGCCSYGAHFADRADRLHVTRVAKRLTGEQWQFARQGRSRGIAAKTRSGDWRTRLVDGACIFLNRPGFDGGPGCALHRLALDEGVHFSGTKPEICWQLPLRRVDEEEPDGSITSTLSEFSRSAWGSGGGDFAWWCTEAPEAFTGAEPVYRSMASELRAMLGDELYETVVRHLESRRASSVPVAPHPAETPVRIVTRRRNSAPRAGGK